MSTYRAVCQIRTWFKACNIPTKESVTPGYDLVVTSQDGRNVNIVVSDEPNDGKDAIVIASSVLTGRKIQKALDEFHRVTQALGYGTPSPVNRGALPKKKANYKDDFEGVVLRHQELHRSPNPTTSELVEYEPTMNKCIKIFWGANQYLFRAHGMDIDDLTSIARAWTVSFIASNDPNRSKDIRMKDFYFNLGQRLAELKSIIGKKSRNIFVNYEDVAIALHDRTLDDPGVPTATVTEDDEADESFIARRRQINTNSITARAKSAHDKLHELLNELPHDVRIARLREVMEADFHNPEARSLAGRMLRAHTKTCAECAHLEILEDDEDVSGGDSDG